MVDNFPRNTEADTVARRSTAYLWKNLSTDCLFLSRTLASLFSREIIGYNKAADWLLIVALTPQPLDVFFLR